MRTYKTVIFPSPSVGQNYFYHNILSTKYLTLNISTNSLKTFDFWIFILYLNFWDCVSRQPIPSGKLLLILLSVRFSLKFFELLLKWVDMYFVRSLSFSCMTERIQADLFIEHFNLKYRLADLIKHYFKFISLLYQERSKQL